MRPRQFDTDTALNAAMQVFWSKGFEAASIDDLCGSMGIARSSFYQAFGSKRELLGEALALYTSHSITWLNNMLAQERPFSANIRAMLEYFVDNALSGRESRSCFLGNVSAELSGLAEDDTAMIAVRSEQIKKVFHDAALQAQMRGELRAGLSPDALPHFLYAAVQGLRLSIKVTHNRADLMGIVDTLMQSIEHFPKSGNRFSDKEMR